MIIERIDSPDHHFIQQLGDGLSTHASQALGREGFHATGVRALDDDGACIGGIHAWVNWNWLQIYLVWIDEAHRGRGLGTRMLAEIEQIGREQGCEHAHLDSFSFQAPEFYERHGYQRFAELDDYPPGQRRIFLRKSLT